MPVSKNKRYNIYVTEQCHKSKSNSLKKGWQRGGGGKKIQAQTRNRLKN